MKSNDDKTPELVADRPKREASEPWRELMADPRRVNTNRLWRLLDEDEKVAAAQAYLDAPTVDNQKPNRDMLVEAVAAARNFRIAKIKEWPDSGLLDTMKRVPVHFRLADSLLRAFAGVPYQRALANRFAGLLGLASPDAVLHPATEVGDAAVQRAADHLRDEHGERDAVVHFLLLALRNAPVAESLREWMGTQVQQAVAPPVELSPEIAEKLAQTEELGDEPGREQTFTTLDRLVMHAVENTKDGIEGALSKDEMDDVVDDYASLNGGRQRSHFHAGFRDTLFKRPVRPPSDRLGARWYWAGAIQGWARTRSWANIVQAYDEQGLVRGLGDDSPASTAAVRHVVRALRKEGRTDELAKYVTMSGLSASPTDVLFDSLQDAALHALHDGDAAVALPIFKLLERAAKDAWGPSARVVLDVRRRRAHCLREMDRPDDARKILETLLTLDDNPETCAMVHADLGLLDGQFRNLNDVRLPQQPEALEGLTQQLEAGQARFERAVENDVRYASHGRYCLGVLALCAKQYGLAQQHLERARTVIVGGRGHYAPALKARIDLYLGIATVLAVMEPSQSGRGSSEADLQGGTRRIKEGLDHGASFPPYLVGEAMEALDLGGPEDLVRVAKLILEKGGERALDELAAAAPAVTHCTAVADALFARACQRMRTKVENASDLHAALRGYRGPQGDAAGMEASALKVLDLLEGYAFDGIESDRFMELLRGNGDYDCPPWTVYDARVARARCLEAEGRTEDAAEVLRWMVHRFAADRKMFDAEGAFEKIKELGVDQSVYEDIERRLQAEHPPTVVAEARPHYSGGVNILVVGGDDEHQSKYDHKVRAEVERESESIKMEFIRSGWRSDWEPHLERAKRLLGTHDAVVIMRFMRTHFGRKLREACNAADKRWFFCWGGGPTAQARAAIEAARNVASRNK